jgi:hypothetical protein
MHLWVEPAGGEQKSTYVEQKTVTLIYPYPADTRQTVGSISSAANFERRNTSCRGIPVDNRSSSEDIGELGVGDAVARGDGESGRNESSSTRRNTYTLNY